MRKIWIITLFPEYFKTFLEQGVAAYALKGERGISLEVNMVSLREFSPKDFKGVDDSPYGGGPGMVFRPDVLKNALIEGVVKPGNYGDDFKEKLHVIFPSPRGKVWNNKVCIDFAKRVYPHKDLVIICGRYEGIDERFLKNYVDEEISLGDYILTGGELAAMAILDSSVRFIPGVLGNKESSETESFQNSLLEHPQYTRPQEFEGEEVPKVLLSGHHQKIKDYQQNERIRVTKERRPDLLEQQ